MTKNVELTIKIGKYVQARSVVMREKLIETALDVIYDKGFRGASTLEFSRRAGVSRGALLHHFPARSDIMIAAMEHLLQDGTHQIRNIAVKVAHQLISLESFVEFLWQLFSGRFFYISLEFINEARTDAELRDRMVPLVKDFHAALDGIWNEFEKQFEATPRATRVGLNLTICLVRGMGVQTVLKNDPEYFQTMLDTWKRVLPGLLHNE
ncbi:transcriptional regulator, TetR family [Pseudorhodobacter antarcticus]|jgi:AcrR family transcriptional regulator|uniref:Transcriptional regulator, TetR family n=1 Tax=Pseudorhodobacter antarcticus TaxID=1077947 RepID=A0A1H8KS17_9RHOB|nr:TetR/AcrR family transcriptional regulator [Pseudorhodobacter antarcticus]SEN95700.1 transcriptional regulator, TetR family [Pseudorhodobacter antarcticus]